MHTKILNNLKKADLSRNQMISEISNSDETLINFKRDLESWNILEVAEHCKNMEAAIIYNIIKYQDYPSKRVSYKDYFKFALLKIALKGRLKFKVPSIKGLLPEGNLSPSEIISGWNEVREQFKIYLNDYPEEKLNNTVFKHPRAGFLTIVQTVDFINDHTWHHINQINRIKKHFQQVKKRD